MSSCMHLHYYKLELQCTLLGRLSIYCCICNLRTRHLEKSVWEIGWVEVYQVEYLVAVDQT